jgi:tape measure domain-containing protein
MRAVGKTDLFLRIFGSDQSKRAFDSFNKNAKSAENSVKRIATVLVGAFSVKEIAEAANVMIGVRNRMNALTGSADKTTSAMNQMRRVASDSRSDFDAVAMLYTRLALATEHLGATQRDVADATQTVANTFIIAGSHAQEANNSARQLAQGLASGALRGDELRSVMENNTILTKMLADGLNMTIGELREFGHAGKLTAETVMPILIKGTKETNEQITKMPMTLGQAAVALRNNFQFMIGDIEELTGIFSKIAGAVGFLANNMDALLIPALVVVPPLALAAANALYGMAFAIAAVALANPITALVVGLTTLVTAAYVFRNELVFVFQSVATKWIPYLALKFAEGYIKMRGYAHDLFILPLKGMFVDSFNFILSKFNDFIGSVNKVREQFGANPLDGITLLSDPKSAQESNKKKLKAIADSAEGFLNKKIEKMDLPSIMDLILGRTGKEDDETGFGKLGALGKFLVAAEEGYGKFVTSIKTMQDEIGDVIKNSYNGLTNLTMEFLEKGKASFKDFATSIVRELIRIAIQKLLLDKMFASFGKSISLARDSFTSGIEFDKLTDGGTLFDSIPSGNGGGFTGFGSRSGGLDNKGGFLSVLHPNETVIDHTKTQPQQTQQQAPTVNFNISTVDAAGFDQLLASRKGLITSIINNAMNNQGKMGIV